MKFSRALPENIMVGEIVSFAGNLPIKFTNEQGHVFLKSGFIETDSAEYDTSVFTNQIWANHTQVRYSVSGDGQNAIYVEDDFILTAGRNHRIHRSTDGGVTWTIVYNPAAGTGSFATKIAKFGTRLFVIGNNNLLVTSDDDGVTWTPRTSGASASTVLNDIAYYNGSSHQFIVLVGASYYRVSQDMGVTWNMVSNLQVGTWQALALNDELVIAISGSGSTGRIMSPNDPGSYTSGTLSSASVVPNGTGIYYENGYWYITGNTTEYPYRITKVKQSELLGSNSPVTQQIVLNSNKTIGPSGTGLFGRIKIYKVNGYVLGVSMNPCNGFFIGDSVETLAFRPYPIANQEPLTSPFGYSAYFHNNTFYYTDNVVPGVGNVGVLRNCFINGAGTSSNTNNNTQTDYIRIK